MKITENHSLKNNNTFGIDVQCSTFACIDSVEELEDFSENILKNEKFYILGGGSNTLFTKNFGGIIIHPEITGIEIVEESSESVVVCAAAGEEWDNLINFCIKNELYGLENLTAIPGLVGSAPVQNIGAYGVEVKDCILKVSGFDFSKKQLSEFSNAECGFSYRNSVFKANTKRDFLITHVFFRLSRKKHFNLSYNALAKTISDRYSEPTLKAISDTVREIRDSKLPDYRILGNCGSFFKNPVVSEEFCAKLLEKHPDLVVFDADGGNKKLSAGHLIEKCGWKGRRVGNAGVYPKQALVLVNYGNASPDEILNLAGMIVSDVRNEFGVELEMEINRV